MSELNDFISTQHKRDIEVAEALASIAQSQKDMSARLFGSEGQKGMLPYMIEAASSSAKELQAEVKSIEDRTNALEGWKRSSKAWLGGAFAVLSLEGTALGMYFNRIAQHAQNIASLHK
jgi:hypothetical protein